MYIDPHVHCRDGRQAYKETIAHALDVAKKAGVDAIFDMPNTSPPIINRELVDKRLAIANDCNSSVFYGLYVGLTSNSEQIQEAVQIHNDYFPRVVGLKLFAGKSVGDLAVIDAVDQKKVYENLKNYTGVLAVHCEKECFLNPGQFYPGISSTHSFARPARAELESIKDQVEFAMENDFKGNLHIAHISTPKSVEYLNEVKKDNELKFDISCGATPHHLFLNYQMPEYKGYGLSLKVNPPLRMKSEQRGLLNCLKNGEIDFIETDHAPHKLDEKLNSPYMSGIPGLDRWPDVYHKLITEGFSYCDIEDLVFNNAHRIFNIPTGVIERKNDAGKMGMKEYDYKYDFFEK